MNKENIVNSRLQKAVKRIVANEYYLAQYYMFALFAVNPQDKNALCEPFKQTEGISRAAAGQIIEWLARYGVDIPYNEQEMKKCGTPEIVKKASNTKKGQSAGFYVNAAESIEKLTMKAYKDILDMDSIEYFTDLQSLLWQCYYNHGDTINKLQTVRIALDAGCDLIMN